MPGMPDSMPAPERAQILASNTSTEQIAATTRRPGDIIGLHFFSPAQVMHLLEVVRGEQIADDVLVTSPNLDPHRDAQFAQNCPVSRHCNNI